MPLQYKFLTASVCTHPSIHDTSYIRQIVMQLQNLILRVLRYKRFTTFILSGHVRDVISHVAIRFSVCHTHLQSLEPNLYL